MPVLKEWRRSKWDTCTSFFSCHRIKEMEPKELEFPRRFLGITQSKTGLKKQVKPNSSQKKKVNNLSEHPVEDRIPDPDWWARWVTPWLGVLRHAILCSLFQSKPDVRTSKWIGRGYWASVPFPMWPHWESLLCFLLSVVGLIGLLRIGDQD